MRRSCSGLLIESKHKCNFCSSKIDVLISNWKLGSPSAINLYFIHVFCHEIFQSLMRSCLTNRRRINKDDTIFGFYNLCRSPGNVSIWIQHWSYECTSGKWVIIEFVIRYSGLSNNRTVRNKHTGPDRVFFQKYITPLGCHSSVHYGNTGCGIFKRGVQN